MGDWITVLFQNAREHPVAVLSSLLVAALVAGAMKVSPFVMSSDFNQYQQATGERLEQVEYSLCSIEKSVDKASIDTQLRAVESEIWQLESTAQKGEANERDNRRLYDLRNTERRLNTALRDLERCPKPVVNGPAYAAE